MVSLCAKELGKLRGKAARAHPAAASSTSSSATASTRTSIPSRQPDLHAESSAFINKATQLPAKSTRQPPSSQQTPPRMRQAGRKSKEEGKKGGKGINPANVKVWRPGFPRGRYFHV